MTEIEKLKVQIFDIEQEQKALQFRFQQLNQQKEPLFQQLNELMKQEKK